MIVLNYTTNAASEKYHFTEPVYQKRFDNLIKDFRCVTCQNQNLADSSAPIAESMRDAIYEQVNSGKSDEAIQQYLVSRYGDFVLYNPPFKPETWVLWLGPFILFVIAICFAANTIFIRNKE